MKINKIIEDIHKRKIVEQICFQVGRGEDPDNIKDLIQDVYLALLEKPKKQIISMYEKNELNFFLASIIVRQIRSSTSPYYRKYKKFRNRSKPIIDSLLKTDD